MKYRVDRLRSWLGIILQMSLSGFVICLVVAFWFKLMSPGSLPFKNVKIIVLSARIDTADLKKVVENNIDGGFFSLHKTLLKQKIEALPWVADVMIKRIWPATLILTVQERLPQARWNATGVVDEKGNIFHPNLSSLPSDLPWLIGPQGSEEKVIQQYQWMNQQLKKCQLSISKLTLTSRLAWQVSLNNHIVINLGREDVDQRFTRFVALYKKLIGGKAKNVQSVDLRYPNGLAILWKSSSPVRDRDNSDYL